MGSRRISRVCERIVQLVSRLWLKMNRTCPFGNDSIQAKLAFHRSRLDGGSNWQLPTIQMQITLAVQLGLDVWAMMKVMAPWLLPMSP
jgi:hypothetical protein